MEKNRRTFSFKSKTIDGRSAKFEVIVDDDLDALVISKIIFSKDELRGFWIFRKFKWGMVLIQNFSIKKASLFTICQEALTKITHHGKED